MIIFHKSVTKLVLDLFEDQREEVVMVKRPNIQYLWKALNVLCTEHPVLNCGIQTVACIVSEKFTKI